MSWRTSRPSTRHASAVCASTLAVLMLVTAIGPAGCRQRNRELPPRARSVAVDVDDVPTPLRGTVGGEAVLTGLEPTLASGIGFVVGLDGTGGQPMPENIAAHLEREMARGGIGLAGNFEGTALEGMTPRRLLRDPNTAAVIVQAIVPPGATRGNTFDVFVRAVNATSLEGGRLWTTELRAGPPSSFQDRQRKIIGEASGPIFINPFAEPSAEFDGVSRTSGRILAGGYATTDLVVELALDNPSHARARYITSAINSRFPAEPGSSTGIAKGRNDEIIQVRVPLEYQETPSEFLRMIEFLQVDQTFPQVYARRYTSALQSDPYLAEELSYALQAIGFQALPFLRDLYEYPEDEPRLAALRAGARLNDAMTVDHLLEIANDPGSTRRTVAIELLKDIDAGPRVDQSLRRLLADDALTARVAAYEALADRAELAQLRRIAASTGSGRVANGPGLSALQIEILSRISLPEGTIQGVSRELVEGKFFLDRAPVGDALIYITQHAEPKIVLFGEDLRLKKPLFVSMWDDRLVLSADSETDDIRLFYRDDRTRRIITQTVSDSIPEFIAFLAQQPEPEDPRPGLSMTYSEVVGVIHQIWRARGIVSRVDGPPVAFSTERDRLLAELIDLSREDDTVTIRPELPGDPTELVVFDDPTAAPAEQAPPEPPADGRPWWLVPLNPDPATVPETEDEDADGE